MDEASNTHTHTQPTTMDSLTFGLFLAFLNVNIAWRGDLLTLVVSPTTVQEASEMYGVESLPDDGHLTVRFEYLDKGFYGHRRRLASVPGGIITREGLIIGTWLDTRQHYHGHVDCYKTIARILAAYRDQHLLRYTCYSSALEVPLDQLPYRPEDIVTRQYIWVVTYPGHMMGHTEIHLDITPVDDHTARYLLQCQYVTSTTEVRADSSLTVPKEIIGQEDNR